MVYLPLKTEGLDAGVGDAPLMFDETADIITEDVGVAELEVELELVELGPANKDPEAEDE